jgi:hypothetical protein
VRSLKARSGYLKTIFTENRFIAGRLEWYFGSFSATSACGLESFTRLPFKPATAAPLLFIDLAARRTPGWVVVKTLGGVKLLFTGRENKLISTVTTGYNLILVHYKNLLH